MVDIPLPPGLDAKELQMIPPQDREDAIQEAWVAHLEGKNPTAAAWRYAKQELRHRARQVQYGSANDLPDDANVPVLRKSRALTVGRNGRGSASRPGAGRAT